MEPEIVSIPLEETMPWVQPEVFAQKIHTLSSHLKEMGDFCIILQWITLHHI